MVAYYTLAARNPPFLRLMPRYPGLLASVGLLFLGLAAALLTLLAGGALGASPTFLILASSLAGSGLALGVGLRSAGRPWRDALLFGPHPRRGWAPLVPLLAGAVLLSSEMENLMRAAWPPPRFFAETMRQILNPDSPLDRALAFLLAGLLAPAIEELLFRGLILQGLASRHGPAWGVTLSTALFGAYHLYPWQAVPALALALLLGWVTWRSGRIGFAVALHVGNNLLALTLAGLDPGLPGLTPRPEGVAHVPPLTLAAAALLLAWGAAAFARAFPSPEPPPDRGLREAAAGAP